MNFQTSKNAMVSNKKKTRGMEIIAGYLFIAPAIIMLLVLIIYPIFRGFVLSFTDSNLLKSWTYNFNGLENYRTIFADEVVREVLFNVFKFALTVVTITIILGLFLGIVLNSIKRAKNIIRALVFLPWVLPEVIVGSIWRWMLNGDKGILNSILVDKLHLLSNYVQWLDESHALFSAAAVYIWRTYPFVTIMISAGLQSIPQELYESAEIDGANKWQTFLYITIPQLRFVLTISTLITTLWTINGFGILNVLTGGGPLNASTTLPILIYETAFQHYRMGLASALSVVQFVIVLIFSLIYLRFTNPMKEEV
ncbi:MAG: carbohydrate ABC transporter permease [Desulfitobacteriaceae bacterium]